MADFEVQIGDLGEEVPTDISMDAGGEASEIETVAPIENGNLATDEQTQEEAEVDEVEREIPKKVTFADYLKTPIIELVVGAEDNQTIFTAHQGLLVQSPWFEDACSRFSNDTVPRRIEMFTDDLDAVGCIVEYLYKNEYYPEKIAGQRGLTRDPTVPDIDKTGEQLLKHARVYTLADKLGMGPLKTLAHSKIHCVNSSAKGEIAYARYVYATTPQEDETIRKPVASFWAHRSHVLRREADDEFRQMCLEFPQFAFDVLTRVLDEKLKKEGGDKAAAGPGSSRKRQRQSHI